MKKNFILGIVTIVTLGWFSVATAEQPKKGDVFFTRTNLKASGGQIYFHNLSANKGFIPVGTQVRVQKVTKAHITIETVTDKATYDMAVFVDKFDKYFVKNVDEIGLNKISHQYMERIKSMKIDYGMTKEEVFISRGCPSFIGRGEKTYAISLENIMQSDIWYYNQGSSRVETRVEFKDGVVSKVGSPSGK